MMIALCSTTIHIPHALKLMRKCSDDVRFFVAADDKTPSEVFQMSELAQGTGIFNCYVPGKISDSKWKCSDAIGFSTLSRRNIAFLEALKWGADVIYSWDDDNLPIGTDHFDLIEGALGYPFSGIKLSGTG